MNINLPNLACGVLLFRAYASLSTIYSEMYLYKLADLVVKHLYLNWKKYQY